MSQGRHRQVLAEEILQINLDTILYRLKKLERDTARRCTVSHQLNHLDKESIFRFIQKFKGYESCEVKSVVSPKVLEELSEFMYVQVDEMESMHLKDFFALLYAVHWSESIWNLTVPRAAGD